MFVSCRLSNAQATGKARQGKARQGKDAVPNALPPCTPRVCPAATTRKLLSAAHAEPGKPRTLTAGIDTSALHAEPAGSPRIWNAVALRDSRWSRPSRASPPFGAARQRVAYRPVPPPNE
jgi:hypothetical protein